jgi:hypothetical protein
MNSLIPICLLSVAVSANIFEPKGEVSLSVGLEYSTCKDYSSSIGPSLDFIYSNNIFYLSSGISYTSGNLNDNKTKELLLDYKDEFFKFDTYIENLKYTYSNTVTFNILTVGHRFFSLMNGLHIETYNINKQNDIKDSYVFWETSDAYYITKILGHPKVPKSINYYGYVLGITSTVLLENDSHFSLTVGFKFKSENSAFFFKTAYEF